MTLVSHTLNLVLVRRPLSAYESARVRIFLIANAPAYFGSVCIFRCLQESVLMSSRLNSDITSVAFLIVSAAQWFAVSVLCSRMQRSQD